MDIETLAVAFSALSQRERANLRWHAMQGGIKEPSG